MTTTNAAVLPLMMGLPDNRQIGVSPAPASPSGFAFNFLGNSRIGTHLAPAFKQRLMRVFFGPEIPIRVPEHLRQAPLINAIGDPDISSISLRMLRDHVDATNLPCFNHPAAVLGNSRDGVARKLAGIDGVWTPRTIRLRIEEPDDLQRAAHEHDLQWPLILRVAGSHRGVAMVKVDDPAQTKAALRGLQWGGRDLYLTEYVDCRDADGHWRKMRVVVAGDGTFLRHRVIANRWLVHVGDRELGHMAEEEAALRDFDAQMLPAIGTRVRAIADALGMDYFGIDCNLRPDGRLLIFEANALMDILHNSMTSPNCWDAAIARIHEALVALLFDPARWRHGRKAIATT